MNESAVKKYAFAQNLPLLQPEKLRSPEFLDNLKSLRADLQVVVAFRMLPEAVWNMPPLGTINLHGSLLPHYRGAAPINWAVINGEKETGVTTFRMEKGIDTGNILLQDHFPVGDEETAGEVHDRMKEIGAQLLLKTVQGLADGTLKEKPQSSLLQGEGTGGNLPHPAGLKHAPKISKETCLINWSRPAEDIFNLIRGLSPFPGAFTILNDKIFKIFRSKKEMIQPDISAGEYETDGKHFLKFACTNGYIQVLELQLEGKKKMGIEEFLRGYRLSGNK